MGVLPPKDVEPRLRTEEFDQGITANTTCPCGKVCNSTTGLLLLLDRARLGLDIKGYVARNNATSNLGDVETLTRAAI